MTVVDELNVRVLGRLYLTIWVFVLSCFQMEPPYAQSKSCQPPRKNRLSHRLHSVSHFWFSRLETRHQFSNYFRSHLRSPSGRVRWLPITTKMINVCSCISYRPMTQWNIMITTTILWITAVVSSSQHHR